MALTTGDRAIDDRSSDAKSGGMIVGIDGSGSSIHALEWAARRTDRYGPIQPVIAWHHPWWSYLRSPAPDPAPFEAAARAEIDRAVSSVRSSDVAEPIVVRARAVSTLVEIGSTAGLIVVGSHGRSGLADGLVGSVAAGVVAQSSVPVAVVPPRAPVDDFHRRVVVGVDGSRNSMRALEWAARNVPATSVIDAVHAWTPGWELPDSTPDEGNSAGETRARSVLDRSVSNMFQTVPVAPPLRAKLASGDPRSVLREWSILSDLLVVGARGRGAVAHLLLGSVATALVDRPLTTTVVIPGCQ